MKLLKVGGLYCLISLILLYLFPIGNTVAIDSEPRIDIGTTPAKRLFTIENMKPGDWSTKTLTIENRGNIDFNYTLTCKYTSGSKLQLPFKTLDPEDFYNQLLLKVEGEEGILYDGKLSDFNGLEKRYLAAFTNEDLTLTVEFPWESGNEFQGLATTFLIILTAEGKGKVPDPDPEPDPVDPDPTPGPDPDPGSDPDPSPETFPEPGPTPSQDSDPSPDTNLDSIQTTPAPEEQQPIDQPDVEFLVDSTLEVMEEEPSEGPQPGLPSILPKTGELNPIYFFITGLMITLLGLFLFIFVSKVQRTESGRLEREE